MSISGSQQGPGDSIHQRPVGRLLGRGTSSWGNPAGLRIPREWGPGVLGSGTVHSAGLLQAGRGAGASSAAAPCSLPHAGRALVAALARL